MTLGFRSRAITERRRYMTEEELKKLCDAWIAAEAELDEDGYYGDAELRNAGFRLEHAGRYSLEIRPKDFAANKFGEYSQPDEDGRSRSMLWWAFASPDENYYFGELELQSRPAYDAALLGEALRDSEPLDGASDAFALVFAAIGKRDYKALGLAMKAGGIVVGEAPGEMVMDEVPGIVGSLTVFPL